MERIFAKSTLREFWKKHPDSEQYLKTWYDTVLNSNWKNHEHKYGEYKNFSQKVYFVSAKWE